MQLDRLYSDEQRAAAVEAYSQPGVTAARVVELAAAGELTGEPFELNENSVRDFARKARRAESRPSPLLEVPHDDACENVRRRAVQLADAELRACEAQEEGKRDLTRLRAAIRCVEGAKKIPAGPAPRPVRGRPPERAGAESNGQAGALLADHRAASAQPLPPVALAAPEPESAPPELSRADQLRAELRADVERIQREQEQAAQPPAEPAWPQHRPVGESAAERRRRRQPEEDTSSWR